MKIYHRCFFAFCILAAGFFFMKSQGEIRFVCAAGVLSDYSAGESVQPESSAEPDGTPGDLSTAAPTETPAAVPTETPANVPGNAPTDAPTVLPTETPDDLLPVVSMTPLPESTPKEDMAASTPKITPVPLKKVTGVSVRRYDTNSVQLKWTKSKKAKYYRVYKANKKNGTYQLVKITKQLQYRVKKLKNHTKYYFYVVASTSKKKSGAKTDSMPSKKVSVKMKTYRRETIFAGDSITEGIGYGDTFRRMSFSGKKKTVAAVGLNTVTFHTKRVFRGQTGLKKLIAERPARVFMMLGMNEIHYRPVRDMIAEYKGLIREIKGGSPNTEIILCAVSPVTKSLLRKSTGFRQIPIFNRQLQKLAKQTNLRYLDYTDFLKDKSGYLKPAYAERDGYHWKLPVYAQFAKQINQYIKKIDA